MQLNIETTPKVGIDNKKEILAASYLLKLSNLAAGSSHTCVDGRYGLYCWGDNLNGQLNIPNFDNFSKT